MLFKSKRSVISWVALVGIHLISLSLISHSALAFSEREVRLYRMDPYTSFPGLLEQPRTPLGRSF